MCSKQCVFHIGRWRIMFFLAIKANYGVHMEFNMKTAARVNGIMLTIDTNLSGYSGINVSSRKIFTHRHAHIINHTNICHNTYICVMHSFIICCVDFINRSLFHYSFHCGIWHPFLLFSCFLSLFVAVLPSFFHALVRSP